MRLPRNTLAWLCLLALLGAVIMTYANHFQNGFHFDDFHTVTGNVFVRDVNGLMWELYTRSTSTFRPSSGF